MYLPTQIHWSKIKPARINNAVYDPITESDPKIQVLIESIQKYGIRSNITVTLDMVIVSGHRRFFAGRLAGIEYFTCNIEPIQSSDPGFPQLLATYNETREKSIEERLREIAILQADATDPEQQYRTLLAERAKAAYLDTETLQGVMPRGEARARAQISAAKRPMLNAVLRVLEEQQAYLPISDRQIHYRLLNNSPLRHARKPESTYKNDRQSYQDLTDLLTRARLDGSVPMNAISDETRPVETWRAYKTLNTYLEANLPSILGGYWRNLMQSQPNHIEIIAEKMTVGDMVRRVASDYTIPVTVARGYISLPPRAEIVKRFRDSGKANLILLILSDLDPDGDNIASSLVNRLEEDFQIDNVQGIRVGVLPEHITRFNLTPSMDAKATSSQYRSYIERHGIRSAYELESLTPEQLQGLLREAINQVIDKEAYQREIEADRADAVILGEIRARMLAVAMPPTNPD